MPLGWRIFAGDYSFIIWSLFLNGGLFWPYGYACFDYSIFRRNLLVFSMIFLIFCSSALFLASLTLNFEVGYF